MARLYSVCVVAQTVHNTPRELPLSRTQPMQFIFSLYDRLVLKRPRATLVALFVVIAFFGYFAPQFKLDASADSLLLEDDVDLRYYRGIRARYGSDSYLLITYTGRDDLFSDASISKLQALRDELRAVPAVESVTTMLDVPLVSSPPTSLQELQTEVPNLQSPRTDRELAERELIDSPLYRQLIMSADGRTTAVLVTFKLDPVYVELLRERDELREIELSATLSPDEQQRMGELGERIKMQRDIFTAGQQEAIATIRQILDKHRDGVDIYLGGLPMIIADMLEYIADDVLIFGLTIVVFLIVLLSAIFVRPRWVVLPMLCCLLSVVVMVGYLGLVRWPVTVVSANFIALLLTFSMSLTVHLIVRYRELHAQKPTADQHWLISQTIRDKFAPCAYTALTTMVAFASLIVSGVRPVMDFGWMMVIGMAVVMFMVFTLFPAALLLIRPGVPQERRDFTGVITGFLARLIQSRPALTLLFYAFLAVGSLYGVSLLTVENRFIDNFKETTDIYQGLLTIDRELGGTTPLDVVIDADPAFFSTESAEEEFADEFEDEFEDQFADEEGDGTDLGATSYWYNTYQLKTVKRVHEYLDSLTETGKVLSMATTMDTLQAINDDDELTTFFLSILYKRLPDIVKETLFDPYMSGDGNQVRFSVRVFETDPNLRRAELLKEIRNHLINEMEFKPEQVKITGMLVLYNNLLQSLYRSQILTLGAVFSVVLLMFIVLFRSLWIAFLALVPNVLAAGCVLGLMGVLGIPLDIMTITIAAITVGIGVDNSIHYIHRFNIEFQHDRDYRAAVQRSHGSIGRAMYYTSIIIASGFSILMLSKFIPTICFGAFTAFAMLFAMIANLTLLPLLLILFKPYGPQGVSVAPANA